MNKVETGCVFVGPDGQKFEAGGAVVTPEIIIGYLGKDMTLTDWHGRVLGTYRIVSRWRTPNSFVSDHMYQVEATVDGRLYTGRSQGTDMIYKGKRKLGKR